MDLGPPGDDQDVQIISGESNYWQKWEEEVRFNSGRTHAREFTPWYLRETINETTEQLADPEHEGEGRLLIAEPGGEYVKEHCDDPLADKKDTKLNCHDAPLDLTIEADRQLRQPDIATDDTHSQAEVEDDSHLPTEAYPKTEIEKLWTVS